MLCVLPPIGHAPMLEIAGIMEMSREASLRQALGDGDLRGVAEVILVDKFAILLVN